MDQVKVVHFIRLGCVLVLGVLAAVSNNSMGLVIYGLFLLVEILHKLEIVRR